VSHDFHDNLVGIVFKDGCNECEYRTERPERMFAWMDKETFTRMVHLANDGPGDEVAGILDRRAVKALSLARELIDRADRLGLEVLE
jgi:hypothetical protein